MQRDAGRVNHRIGVQGAPSATRGGLTSHREANPPQVNAEAIRPGPLNARRTRAPAFYAATALAIDERAGAGGAGNANEGGAILR